MVAKQFKRECHNCRPELDCYRDCADRVNPENMKNFLEVGFRTEKRFEEIGKK